ncbi:MAG: hypothetical protein ACJAX5_003479 [Patiriisocius sp.]|jgi:hypothetical protein
MTPLVIVGVVQDSALWSYCENFNDFDKCNLDMNELTQAPQAYGKVYKTLHWLLVFK